MDCVDVYLTTRHLAAQNSDLLHVCKVTTVVHAQDFSVAKLYRSRTVTRVRSRNILALARLQHFQKDQIDEIRGRVLRIANWNTWAHSDSMLQ